MSATFGYKELGQFLKAKRERISPTQAGLPYGNRRRTPGLKREEVADMAAVSLTWYTWLEQGRSIKVSEQVLESVGRALMLNDTEMKYIFSLAQMAIPESKSEVTAIISKPLQDMLNKLDPYPAFASDQYWNVIGWNASAVRIFGDFGKMKLRERNTVWRMFMNPKYQILFENWEKNAAWMVAQFRIACGMYVSDQWFKNFVEELMGESEDFKELWLKHSVVYEGEFKKSIVLEPLGGLLFDFTSLDVSENPYIKIAVHTPADELTEEKLTTLDKVIE